MLAAASASALALASAAFLAFSRSTSESSAASHESRTSLSFSSSSNLLRRMAPTAGEAGGVLDSLSSSSMQAAGGQPNLYKATTRRMPIHGGVTQARGIIWKPQRTGINKVNGPAVSYPAVCDGPERRWLRPPTWPFGEVQSSARAFFETHSSDMYGTAGPRDKTL